MEKGTRIPAHPLNLGQYRRHCIPDLVQVQALSYRGEGLPVKFHLGWPAPGKGRHPACLALILQEMQDVQHNISHTNYRDVLSQVKGLSSLFRQVVIVQNNIIRLINPIKILTRKSQPVVLLGAGCHHKGLKAGLAQPVKLEMAGLSNRDIAAIVHIG